MTKSKIYQDMADRTAGGIYVAVVGPVRTGKSTLIKRMMEQIVIPNIRDPHKAERARDELPQSASGKTIMTAEPKFVPEEPVEILSDGGSPVLIRMIDSVGYMIPGAAGAEEDGVPRMISTPWQDEPIPMAEAAELGTRKVMEEHCTVGIVVTTDGSITDIPRQDYVEAEYRSIEDMKRTGKPFVVVVNSQNPDGPEALALRSEIEQQHGVGCIAADCMAMTEWELSQMMLELLMDFPVAEYQFWLPRWLERLELTHPMKQALYAKIREDAAEAERMRDAEKAIQKITELSFVLDYQIPQYQLGCGAVHCVLNFPDRLFYEVLTEKSGFTITDDGDLMKLLQELSAVKREYDGFASALESVRATGYGIVMPTQQQMTLEMPEIVKKGGSYGVRLRAGAPSIHMMRADVRAEICPIVGDEHQAKELLQYLMGGGENTEHLWESSIYGKSVANLIGDSLQTKLQNLPETTRLKLKDTLTRMINEGCNGLICFLF